MMIFKIAPDYTIAHHNGQCLDEWIGQTVEKFVAAMGRPADHVETTTIAGREIVEHIWND